MRVAIALFGRAVFIWVSWYKCVTHKFDANNYLTKTHPQWIRLMVNKASKSTLIT